METIRLATSVSSAEFDVDLKWSLWSQDKGTWQERAPQVLKCLEMMHDNTLIIHTAPRKEIRYGNVTITGTSECSDAKGMLRAVGRFEEHWDEPSGIADTLGVDPNDDVAMDRLIGSLPWADSDGNPGVYREFNLTAVTVAGLLKRVDLEESKLIEESQRLWNSLEATYAG